MDERRRRLKFRCWRRGFRELDLILGHYVDERLDALDENGLDALEALLDEADRDVFDWILERTAAPERHRTPVMAELQGLKHLADTMWRDARPAGDGAH